jgi:hypothetical protein
MAGTEGFLELAGIAGVFVGFGALIAVRSGGSLGVDEIAEMRAMVWMGVLAVVAALAPVTLGRYDVTEHRLWALSSGIVLAGVLVMVVSMVRTPEYRANWGAYYTVPRARWVVAVEGIAYVIWALAVVLVPIVILLGVAPDLEPSLYFTLVVLLLFAAAWVLLELVLADRRPAGA